MPTPARRLAELIGPPSDAQPAYAWLGDRMKGLILDGRILIGDRVPSERTMAAELELSRTTISAAFDALRAEGFLVSRPGSNTVVALPRSPVDRPDAGPLRARPDDIDLSIAALPAPPILGSLAIEAANKLPSFLSGHGLHPMGLRPLRQGIADWLSRRGLATSAEQVLVTQGALHGWDLILRSLARPGDRVMVEQPTYAAVLDAVTAHNAQVLPLGVDAHGWLVPRLARGSRPPALAHITPDFQNPTGFRADEAQRRELLAALPETTFVVDETFADLSFAGSEIPFAALDRSKSAITLGTLSKTVWAGLRVGWIRASPELVKRLALSRSGQDLATPVLDQLLALECLSHLDTIIDQRVELLVQRRDHLIAALRDRAPLWQISRPQGGLVLWVDLGEQSSTQLAWDARRSGVRVIPGTRFSATNTHDRFLRLPFTQPASVLDLAVDRLVGATRSALPPPRGEQARAWTA